MQSLIYLPPSSKCSLSGWFKPNACRWSGADCLRKTPKLSDVYPGLSDFFCSILALRDADLTCITEEVLKVSNSDGLSYISNLLSAFSQHLSIQQKFLESRISLKKKLFTQAIFPIITTQQTGTSYVEFDELRSAEDTDMWFIADRPHLRKCFLGIAPILAIDAGDVSKMDHLMSTFGLNHRFLSRIATGSPKASEDVRVLDESTRLMRRKVRFISRHVIYTRPMIAKLYMYAFADILADSCLKTLRERQSFVF